MKHKKEIMAIGEYTKEQNVEKSNRKEIPRACTSATIENKSIVNRLMAHSTYAPSSIMGVKNSSSKRMRFSDEPPSVQSDEMRGGKLLPSYTNPNDSLYSNSCNYFNKQDSRMHSSSPDIEDTYLSAMINIGSTISKATVMDDCYNINSMMGPHVNTSQQCFEIDRPNNLETTPSVTIQWRNSENYFSTTSSECAYMMNNNALTGKCYYDSTQLMGISLPDRFVS